MSFIRPLLEYGDIIWDNCTNQQKSDTAYVQNEAARTVTGATKYCNVNSMLAELKWDFLTDIRRKHKLIALYQMNHSLSLSPNDIIDLLPTQQQTRYNLRTANTIPPITARTQMYQNTFFLATIRIWNDLPLSVRSLPSLTSFKQSLNSNMSKRKSIFSFGSRRAHVLHGPFRLGCSSLNFDLHRRTIVDYLYYVAVGRSKLSTTSCFTVLCLLTFVFAS